MFRWIRFSLLSLSVLWMTACLGGTSNDGGGDAGRPVDTGDAAAEDTDDGSDMGGDAADGGELDAGDGPDVRESQDARVDAMGDTAPDAESPTACDRDSDSDGLADCDEERGCTDPHDGDTDDDGLGDFEELHHQTDPCSADTDNDGATDKEEIEVGLDPNRTSTFDDGKVDGERWRLSACDDPSGEPLRFYENSVGNWKVALPPAFDNYTELQLEGSQVPEAAAVYDDLATQVTGALLSKEAASQQDRPTEPLRNEVQSAMGELGTVVRDETGGEFETHDLERAAVGHYLVELDSPKSTRRVRDQMLIDLAPFPARDISGLPNSSGARYEKFRIFVSVIFRNRASGGGTQSLLSIGVAPHERYEAVDRVKVRMDDLTNTTNIAEQSDTHLTGCAPFQPDGQKAKAEFYWVLDQSQSMDDENQIVANFADTFTSKVENTTLDYRMGVTNMDPRNNGRLRPGTAWHTGSDTFESEVENAVIDCSAGSSGAWGCHNSQEYGLEIAQKGIRYMTGSDSQAPTPVEEVRSNAEIITIFMSDEEANSVIHGNGDYEQLIQPYRSYFPGRTTAFSMVGNGDDCGLTHGRAYKDIALETGGKFASLCADDLTETIEEIIFSASGQASEYVLPQTPISSSLRVFINGEWVPRSRENGFEYFEETNAIAFFGDFRPDTTESRGGEPGDYIAVYYEAFKNRCKGSGSGDCEPRAP
jgi:hypothetical protein